MAKTRISNNKTFTAMAEANVTLRLEWQNEQISKQFAQFTIIKALDV